MTMPAGFGPDRVASPNVQPDAVEVWWRRDRLSMPTARVPT
jgi:hypothetical protein